MRQVVVEFTIPEDLEPRIEAFAKKMEISFDAAVQLLLLPGSIPRMWDLIESAERILQRSEGKGAAV